MRSLACVGREAAGVSVGVLFGGEGSFATMVTLPCSILRIGSGPLTTAEQQERGTEGPGTRSNFEFG